MTSSARSRLDMTPSLSRLLPWTDRTGRATWPRVVVFALLWLPAMVLAGRWAAGDLGPRPLAEAIHVCGDWAVRLLLVAVAITPLRHLSGSTRLIGVRRMIGLAALAYAAVHVVLWGADLGFAAPTLAFEIAVRPYLTLGFVAFAGLVAMGATSSDAQVRRLGAERWRRLHRSVHPIVMLALVHLFLQSKLDLGEGAVLTGLAGAGVALRVAIERRRLGAPAIAIAGGVAFATAAAAEAIWFGLKTGRAVGPMLAANFDFAARIAPSWIAAAITLAVAAGAFAVRHRGRRGDELAGPAAAEAGRRPSRTGERAQRDGGEDHRRSGAPTSP